MSCRASIAEGRLSVMSETGRRGVSPSGGFSCPARAQDSSRGNAHIGAKASTLGVCLAMVVATSSGPRRQPWGKSEMEIVLKPRQGRHNHDGPGRLLMSPLPWLTRCCEARSHGFRRGPHDVATAVAQHEPGLLTLALMGRWPGPGWIAPSGLSV
jgi:hypothetical protein